MNDLRDKARKVFYAIKRSIKFDIQIRIWQNMHESVIEPIALYGCEAWGPLSNQEFTKLRLRMQNSAKISSVYNVKHQIMHAEQKCNDSKTFHNKAITYREINMEKSPLNKLVLGLCSETQTPQSPRTATQLDCPGAL